ncbi:MAG TPA: DUF3613 domain-containing protein [Solimonas sp.]|nr:DUF3613 domain-containing protein [Solimonas sp.]
MNKLSIVLLALVAPLAQAGDADTPPRVGDETRAWLQLQTDGSAAAPGDRPMSGEVADKVYERYVNSFGQPIPAHLERESAGSSASGDSGSSGGSK